MRSWVETAVFCRHRAARVQLPVQRWTRRLSSAYPRLSTPTRKYKSKLTTTRRMVNTSPTFSALYLSRSVRTPIATLLVSSARHEGTISRIRRYLQEIYNTHQRPIPPELSFHFVDYEFGIGPRRRLPGTCAIPGSERFFFLFFLLSIRHDFMTCIRFPALLGAYTRLEYYDIIVYFPGLHVLALLHTAEFSLHALLRTGRKALDICFQAGRKFCDSIELGWYGGLGMVG